MRGHALSRGLPKGYARSALKEKPRRALYHPLPVHPATQPLVDAPLALVAHDPDPAHLRRIGDVRAAVRLQIEADDVDTLVSATTTRVAVGVGDGAGVAVGDRGVAVGTGVGDAVEAFVC